MFNDTNNVTLTGRLTHPPRIGQGKTKYAFYSIAINKQFGDYKKTVYVNIAAFGKEADYVEAYLDKGKKVHIIGELSTDKNGKLMVIANSQALKENPLYLKDNNDANYSYNEVDDEFKPVVDDDDIPF